MACNMRCRHCGSAAGTRLPGELGTAEALRLCDELAELGVEVVTLSGGEPLLRPDWPLLTRRLVERGVAVNLITNGWLVDRSTVWRAQEAGLGGVGVSLDGIGLTHDLIRCPGSFERATKALAQAAREGVPTAVITTLMRSNLNELPLLQETLRDLGVRLWQLQIGFPLGSLAAHPEECLEPADVPPLLELARAVHEEGSIAVDLGDCLGYYTATSVGMRRARGGEEALWMGCPAGRLAFGVRHDGGICGCNSLRYDRHVEGNVRHTPLRELWERPGAFAWNREQRGHSLSGFCTSCQHGELCRGGCTVIRTTLCSPEDGYTYCAYRLAIERLFPRIDAMCDPDILLQRAAKALAVGLPEVAERCSRRASLLRRGGSARVRSSLPPAFREPAENQVSLSNVPPLGESTTSADP